MNKKIALGIASIALAVIAATIVLSGMVVVGVTNAALSTPEVAQCVGAELGIDLGDNDTILVSLDDPAVVEALEAIGSDAEAQAVVQSCVDSVLG